MSDIIELQLRISELEKDLVAARDNLKFRRSLCKHTWSEVEYKPTYIDSKLWSTGLSNETCKAKPDPSDNWQRTCQVCGLVQWTTKSRAICKKEPVFDGGSAT